MDTIITTLVNGVLVPLINVVVVPLADAVPFLASTGILLAVFAALWVLFGVALVRGASGLDAAWLRLRSLPLPVQAIAWLLFLPVLVGLRVWRTRWPGVARLTVIGGLAWWNLLVFVPRPA
jgi:hypothetical protein